MIPRHRWLLCLFVFAGSAQAAQPVADACSQASVSQDALVVAVTAEVQRIGGEQVKVSVSAMSEWPVISHPKVVLLSRTLRSRMAVTISGKTCDGERQIEEIVWLKVQAFREAWIYGRNAGHDSKLSEVSLRREVIDIAALQITHDELAQSLEGQWLSQAVYAGRPVLRKQLRDEFWVRRDQSVVVVVRGPGLELRTLGKALQSGILGDHVQVLVSGAEASMPTTVAGKGEVHVDVEI